MNAQRRYVQLYKNRNISRYGSGAAQLIHTDFYCVHCHGFVSVDPLVSGVRNRNHCPFCLWSRHLDLYNAGDRLSACKSPMQPVALTIKAGKKKYGNDQGELMLIHLCDGCGGISINRIATDDNTDEILLVFEKSLQVVPDLHFRLESQQIKALPFSERDSVLSQLYGYGGQRKEIIHPFE